MSIDIKTHKAVVHAADAVTGVVYVKIPAVTGQKIVKVSKEGLTQSSLGVYNVPRVGDVCLVALSRNNSDVSWVSGMMADLYRGDVNGVIEAINSWVPGNLEINEPGALATDLIVSRHILAGQIITDKLAANTITADKLQSDAIMSSNYIPPVAGGEYKQQRWSELSETYLTWSGTTVSTEVAFFSADDVGRKMVIAYSDNPYPFGPDSGVWIDFLPWVVITGYTSPTQVTVNVNSSAAPDLVWIGYLILPSQLAEEFAGAGSFFDLENGNIISTGLILDGATGDVQIRGGITATRFSLLDEAGNLVARLDESPTTRELLMIASGNGLLNDAALEWTYNESPLLDLGSTVTLGFSTKNIWIQQGGFTVYDIELRGKTAIGPGGLYVDGATSVDGEFSAGNFNRKRIVFVSTGSPGVPTAQTIAHGLGSLLPSQLIRVTGQHKGPSGEATAYNSTVVDGTYVYITLPGGSWCSVTIDWDDRPGFAWS